MKLFIAALLISTAVIAIGALENPCTTEGLNPTCLSKKNLNQNSQ
jgi:hypothetical protein